LERAETFPRRISTPRAPRALLVSAVPTPFTHPAVPLAIAAGLGQRRVPPRLAAAGMLASVLPDVDVVAFRLGIPYSAAYGHRGATHSLAFALLVALAAMALHRALGASRRATFGLVLAAAASHPLLDALTNGGLGVALLWPLSDERFFSPVAPIDVAPISAYRLFTSGAARVFGSEARWVWAPCAMAATAAWMLRRAVALARAGARPGSRSPAP
jgi:inner membrane protein